MNEELYHYGVLGMKWGVHRARKNAAKASRAKAKGKTEKAAKYDAKAKKLRQKHEDLAGKAAIDYTNNQSTGKTVAKSLLMGTYGTLGYNQARANGHGRGRSAAVAVLANLGNNLTYGLGSIVEPRVTAAYYRHKRQNS